MGCRQESPSRTVCTDEDDAVRRALKCKYTELRHAVFTGPRSQLAEYVSPQVHVKNLMPEGMVAVDGPLESDQVLRVEPHEEAGIRWKGPQ